MTRPRPPYPQEPAGSHPQPQWTQQPYPPSHRQPQYPAPGRQYPQNGRPQPQQPHPGRPPIPQQRRQQPYREQLTGGRPVPRAQPEYVPPPKRRKVWPWVLLTVVMVPILGFVGCSALLGGAVKAVDDARQGGTVNVGDTFTYKSGLALMVTPPVPFKPSNTYVLADGSVGVEVTVAVLNNTPDPVGSALISINATVNSTPAQQVFDGVVFPTQDIAPGQQLNIPFRFQVPKGTTGPLQIAVTDTFNEPVFFTGQL